MKKYLFTFLILFISLTSVKAFSVNSCTPSDEYIKYQSLSEEEKANYIEPFYCKELMNVKPHNKSKTKNIDILSSSLPSSYNSKTQGYVTSIKDQKSLGTCWAFSAISAIESNALKNGLGSYDFSEYHMLYSLLSAGYSDSEGKKGKYLTSDFNGGKITYAPSYYFNGIGQLLEDEMPYEESDAKITLSEYKPGRKIIS